MDRNHAMSIVQDLRHLANMLEVHHEEFPNNIYCDFSSFVGTYNEDQIGERLASVMRSGLRSGAKVTKEYEDSRFRLNLSFDGGVLNYTISAPREEVCTMKVVGKEMVEKRVPPAGEWTTEMVEQDKVEWECHPLLAVTAEDT